MNKKLVIYLFLVVLLISCVSAQYSYDYTGPSLAFDAISNFYFNHSGWIDFFLLFTIFLIMVNKGIGSKFEKQGGKPMILGVSFVLAIALSLWLRRINYNLFEWITINTIFFLFVVVILYYLAYSYIEKIHNKPKWVSALLSYSIIYGFFRVFLGNQFELILSEHIGSLYIYNLAAVDVLYYLSLICLLIGLLGLFFAKKVTK